MPLTRTSKESGPRSSTGAATIRPGTSSTLTVDSQTPTDQRTSSRRGSSRPQTSSTSSQSATPADWDSSGHGSFYGGGANLSSEIDDVNLEPDEFWPGTDSDDDSGEDGISLMRTGTSKSGSTTKRLRAMLQKFGRSYNKNYDFLPNDAQEKDRNVLQHNIVLEMLDGRLHLAPVLNARRVLDLGCGGGHWPLEYARRNPQTFVHGMDIDPITPPYKLANCRFHVADFSGKWSYDAKFDFIHLRHLGTLPAKHVVTNIYENLSPGGWAEFTEWIVSVQSTHNSFTDTYFHKWLRHWKLGIRKLGATVHYPLEYKNLLTETGFKNVTERKYAVPINPWPPSKQLQRIGSMMALNINTILEPMSMPIFTGVLGWSPEALESLLAEVRKEIADVRIHAWMTLFTVYAQKPRGDSSGSSVQSAEPVPYT